MERIPSLDFDQMSDEQRQVYDAIVAGPRGGVRGPLQVWLQSPELAQRAQSLGAYCRYGSSLPPRLSELAILVTAKHWRAGYEWFAHAPFALQGGLPEQVVNSIHAGKRPEFTQDDEEIVYEFATELLHTHLVSDETWKRAQEILGTRTVVDLVGVLGYYGLISMTINAFEIRVPSDVEEPLKK